MWQGRKSQAAAIDEYLQLPDMPQERTRTPVFEPGADPRKFFTEGLPAAYRAARETMAEPTHGQEIYQRQPWTRGTPIPSLLHVGEFVSRLPTAFGRGVAELGPEKAKPLTEALASNLPFLYQRKPPAPLARTVASDLEAGARRALPTTQPGQLPGGQRALPPAPPEGPTVPSFWPNPASLPPREPPALPGRLYTPQFPPRRLGEDLRSRTYFPEKTPYRPETPVEVKGGAREGELLDQYGRPVKGGEPTMPERERLRTLYKGRVGTGPTEAERLESRMRDVATEGGGEFKGIQSIQGRPLYLAVNEPKHGSTIYVPIDEATPAAVRAKLADKVADFEAVKPVAKPEQPVAKAEPVVTGKVTPPAPKTILWQPIRGQGALSAFASKDRRFTVTQTDADTWKATDRQGGDASFPTFHDARHWATERLGTVESPKPFFEKTKIGDQAMIGGTEQRAIPTSKLASKAPQSKISESPLFAQPETAVQQPLGYAGQHYGKTVSPGTAILSDAEEVRILLRDMGGIKPTSVGLDLAATPKEFLNPAGRSFDEIVTEIAEAQGKKPKAVERELTHTLSRYSTLRQELKGEGLMTDIRAKTPPPDVAVSQEEWQQMGPADRRAAVEWYRIFTDESGAMNVGKMVDAWKRFRRRLPMEEAVRKVVPDSPVISEVERWNVGLADGIKTVASSPWWKGIRKMSPELLKDYDHLMIESWKARLSPELRARMQNPNVNLTPQEVSEIRTARLYATEDSPAPLRESMAHRDVQFGRENQSRGYFGLDPIPEEYGPYMPRRTDAEAREAVSLGGGRLGVGRGLQTTVRGHQQERVFESYRQGEAAGTVYEDPRNAIIMREWEGLKLRATHRLFQNLEAKGVLFKDRAAATAASPNGKPWKVEKAPGGTWFARTEEEARFLEQNLTESMKGPTGSFVHYGNQLIRNPSLVNPMPHIVKNMWAKALLARGPVGLYTVPRDAVEYFRGANPTLIREFKDAMPFSSSGRTAGEILGNELRRGPAGEALKTASKALGALNRPSSRVIFEWADPAMRYSLFKHYRSQGLTPYASANHAWVDLIRYGTRSDLIDFWKAVPMNFFVPWRYGTMTALLKQVKNHPVRTALTVAGIDYLREARYRSSGKYTHLPWDYTENPVAILLQNAIDGQKDAKQQAAEAFGIGLTTRFFGPGGAFAATQLVDTLNDMRGKPDWERTKNMFWGISQLYNLKDEWQAFQDTGDVKFLAEMIPTIVLGEHKALTYSPRRLMRDVPEWLPGMQRSELVQQAEQLQQQRAERGQRLREYREQKPRSSIEDKLREAGYLR